MTLNVAKNRGKDTLITDYPYYTIDLRSYS